MAYADRNDLASYGVSEQAWGSDPEAVLRILDAVSSLADSYLRLHYVLPLATPVPAALADAVCQIAAFRILSVRGYNPEGDAGMLEARHDKAIAWLRDIGAGRASLGVDSPPGSAGGPFVLQPQAASGSSGSILVTGSPKPRGW